MYWYICSRLLPSVLSDDDEIDGGGMVVLPLVLFAGVGEYRNRSPQWQKSVEITTKILGRAIKGASIFPNSISCRVDIAPTIIGRTRNNDGSGGVGVGEEDEDLALVASAKHLEIKGYCISPECSSSSVRWSMIENDPVFMSSDRRLSSIVIGWMGVSMVEAPEIAQPFK